MVIHSALMLQFERTFVQVLYLCKQSFTLLW